MSRNPRFILLLAVALTIVPAMLSAQSETVYVRPGDINNSGTVNLIDYLYLGYAYGTEGIPRANASGAWGGPALENGQPVITWDADFPTGVNMAHADCDGNGIIDIADTIWVYQNQGLQHGWGTSMDVYSTLGIPNIDPEINLVPNSVTATGGQLIEVEIALGSPVTPVNNLYGYTFTLRFEDPAVVESVNFAFSNNSWFTTGGLTISQVSISPDGSVDVALTRTDGVPINGYGSLGTLEFVIIEDVVDAMTVESILQIEKALLVDHQLNPISIVQDIENATTTSLSNMASADLSIFPNPSRGQLFVNDKGQKVKRLRLVNSFGQPVYLERIVAVSDFIPIDISTVPTGWYILEVYFDDDQLVMEKVFITN